MNRPRDGDEELVSSLPFTDLVAESVDKDESEAKLSHELLGEVDNLTELIDVSGLFALVLIIRDPLSLDALLVKDLQEEALFATEPEDTLFAIDPDEDLLRVVLQLLIILVVSSAE